MLSISQLQSIPIFGGLRQEAISQIVEHAPLVRCIANEYFVREGDIGESLFVLLAGEALVVCGNDLEHPIYKLKTGDCFGEMALIDHQPRSASIQAATDCVAIEISQDTLFELYQFDAKQYSMFHMNMAREVSRRLRETNESSAVRP